MLHKLMLILPLLLITACNSRKPTAADNGAFAKPQAHKGTNVERIQNSGELIIATLSGPDTYFEYQGRALGLQYALAADFSETLGVGIRVVLCNDTTSLVKALQGGDADLIALQLPAEFCKHNGLIQAGARSQTDKQLAWAVDKQAADLAQALDEWFADGVELKVEKSEQTRLKQRRKVRRKVRAPFISKEKGIISTYDNLFKDAARATGWDWRLIAAQCYQESGFDPNAVSWAGASGLMQIMPATAAHLSLPQADIFKPAENIAAAARYIHQLQAQFADIPNSEERVRFILAAYNAGPGHISDARALARKYGRNPNSWNGVGHYVQCLMQPRFYRDPVVRHGYMIGSETYQYVQDIMERWQQYGGRTTISRPAGTTSTSASNANSNDAAQRYVHKKNRFSKEHKILTPEEMQSGN